LPIINLQQHLNSFLAPTNFVPPVLLSCKFMTAIH
jgi:hypothetical protein